MTESGSGPVYTVEARISDGLNAREVNGVILSDKWQQVPFHLVPPGFGVPTDDLLNPQAVRAGFVSHSAAMALAWWFVAGAQWRPVEVRLVEYDFEYSFSATRKTEGEPIEKLYGRLPVTPGESLEGSNEVTK